MPKRRKKVVDFEFSPGKVGIAVNDETGKVTALVPGGQGEKIGVVVGMRFLKVRGEPYTKEAFRKAITSGEGYLGSFEEAAHQTSSQSQSSAASSLASAQRLTGKRGRDSEIEGEGVSERSQMQLCAKYRWVDVQKGRIANMRTY